MLRQINFICFRNPLGDYVKGRTGIVSGDIAYLTFFLLASEQEHGSHHQNVSSCSVVYQMCFSVMESLHCIAIDNNSTNNTTNSATLAEIYGYGTIMILSVSLLSLLGIIIVPLLKTQNRIGKIIYKYTLTLMIAMGASALLCNVLFDLLPTVSLCHM
jgi:hypothetical protein